MDTIILVQLAIILAVVVGLWVRHVVLRRRRVNRILDMWIAEVRRGT